MPIALVILTLLIGILAGDTASAEIVYPWCKTPPDGGTNCGFTSLEQCRAGGSGLYCAQNPRFNGQSNTRSTH